MISQSNLHALEQINHFITLSHHACSARNNQYDGTEEFWVVTRETGKRQESHSFEETHEKNVKAMPLFCLGLGNSQVRNVGSCKFQCVKYLSY